MLVRILSYKITAWWQCNGRTALGIVQEGPAAYDLYIVKTYLRTLGCREDLLVSRSFRIEDIVALLGKALDIGAKNLVLIDPYIHAPRKPKDYWRLTPINGWIRRLSNRGITVALFNKTTQFGRVLPEGGKMHHHQTHTIVRIDRVGEKSYRATLIKSSTGRTRSATGPLREFFVVKESWDGQYLLSEWF
jgi:hypothetical protein